MRKIITLLLLFICSGLRGQSVYESDFREFWTTVKENHAYLDKQKIDWEKVREIYRPKVAAIKNKEDFIRLLEQVVNELHNGHISLNVNLKTSNRIVPSGADLLVRKTGGSYRIVDLRKGFPAALSGLQIGMEVIAYNDRPIAGQLSTFLPAYTSEHTVKMHEYALDMLFAGTHDQPRKITVRVKGREKSYFPDKYHPRQNSALLDWRALDQHTGYIRINNSLGEPELIPAFDSVLNSFLPYQNLVLDLSETPGGGNTTVARAIMGRFIQKELPYQRHEFDEQPYGIRRSWVEYVSPREAVYRNKLLILVGHWTGSMGEGMAIGFDGIQAGTVVGTRMAGLLGAISNFTLKHTNIGYQVPTERLYHINGTPREDFIPDKLTANIEESWQLLESLLK